MTYGELLPQIKFEAEMSASTDFDDFILNILNQIGKEAVKKFDLIEFLVLGAEVTLTAGTQQVSLPSDWCRLKGNRIYYQSSSDERPRIQLNPLTLRNNQNFNGDAKFFQISGNSLNIVPYSQIFVGDFVVLDYYRKPDMIEDAGDDISEPLEEVLRHGTLARLMAYKDSKRAQYYMGQYSNALIGLAANGTVN